MARRIEFNYDKSIDRATQLFWQQGYSNTSLRELLKAMKIGEGSFYNTVKSKKHLYLECLKYYNETVSRRRLEAFSSPASVREGIRSFFQIVLDELDDPNTPRICLMAGSLSDDVLLEDELKEYIVDEMMAFQSYFTKRLSTAKKIGELPVEFDSEVVAQVIVTYLQGLFRMISLVVSRSEVEKQIELLLYGLGL
jgi:TetR/AcrR family transcriptional regulator, transcriptional repressor for nem operon